MSVSNQEQIDQKNKTFWNELCGTQLAQQLGVVDASPESLAKFDDFYIEYYPYLKKYLLLDKVKDKNVLEVGLGYGTVSQLLALAGANYHGLDIAPNAVAMATHRLEQHHLQGDVRVGSMLDCPFPDNYFDFVISIGCFHHTGDVQKCIDQTHRILKKNGIAVVMVYNAFSLRQWNNWPGKTFKRLITKEGNFVTVEQKKAYDKSSNNEGAPITDFFSKKEMYSILNAFDSVKINRENFDEGFKLNIGPFSPRFKKRSDCLDSMWARLFGLDLYIEATK